MKVRVDAVEEPGLSRAVESIAAHLRGEQRGVVMILARLEVSAADPDVDADREVDAKRREIERSLRGLGLGVGDYAELLRGLSSRSLDELRSVLDAAGVEEGGAR